MRYAYENRSYLRNKNLLVITGGIQIPILINYITIKREVTILEN